MPVPIKWGRGGMKIDRHENALLYGAQNEALQSNRAICQARRQPRTTRYLKTRYISKNGIDVFMLALLGCRHGRNLALTRLVPRAHF